MIKEIRLVNATPTLCEVDNKGKIVRIIRIIKKKTVLPNNDNNTGTLLQDNNTEIRLVDAVPTLCEVGNKGEIVRTIRSIKKRTVLPNNDNNTIIIDASPTLYEVDSEGIIVRITRTFDNSTMLQDSNTDTVYKRDSDNIDLIENKKARSRLRQSSKQTKGPTRDRNKNLWYKNITLKDAKETIKENILNSDNYTLKKFWIQEGKKIRYSKHDALVFSQMVDVMDSRQLNDEEIEEIKVILYYRWRELLARDCLNKYFDFMENIDNYKIEEMERIKNISDATIRIFGDCNKYS